MMSSSDANHAPKDAATIFDGRLNVGVGRRHERPQSAGNVVVHGRYGSWLRRPFPTTGSRNEKS